MNNETSNSIAPPLTHDEKADGWTDYSNQEAEPEEEGEEERTSNSSHTRWSTCQ
jgi:hypothetical protein